MNGRNPYFDFLRGFAIIMVVGIHTVSNGSWGFESIEDICAIILRSILNCAVPLFLAISGYFIAIKKISSSKEHMIFLRKQIPKIYIPCLIFSLPYLILASYTEHHNILKSLVVFFSCGFSVYYFIALIIQYYILLPALVKINKMLGVILTSFVSAVSIICVTWLLKVLGLNIPLLIYAGPFPLWIVFFFMGVYFSKTDRNYNLLMPSILTIIGLGLQLYESEYWLAKGVNAYGIKLSSFIFSAGVIWLLFSKEVESKYTENIIFKTINWIGGISFGIYLLHCYMIGVADKLIPDMNWIGKWVFVLCLTVLFIWIAKAIFPKFSIKYLGFR